MIIKNTFIANKDRIDYAEFMSDEELWMLFRKILQHENWLEEIDLPLEFKFAREKIRKVLDENTEKWINKVGSISEKRSEAWKKHKWNQYTKMEQMEQNGTNGTNGTNDGVSEKWTDKLEQMEQNGTLSDNTNTIIFSNTTSSKNRKKEEMLEAFRHDPRLTPYMEENDVSRRLDQKELIKKPYQDVKSFITSMIKVKNNIASWKPKSDQNRRNRFSFLVDTAIDNKREWLRWYDSVEKDYLDSKDDLYPTPKQNE